MADTDASLRFYRDFLGLKVAGESEDYGDERELMQNLTEAKGAIKVFYEVAELN